MNESQLVMDWIRFQTRIGRNFTTPSSALRAYCDETKTSMRVDTQHEMSEAIGDLRRAMLADMRRNSEA